jgi:two-component system, OmpR family, sensor histidine kinase ChvG
MRLRNKLLLVSLSLLVLPWAGWRFVLEFEAQVRRGQELALLATAEAVARGLGPLPETLGAGEPSLFVQPLPRAPLLDGETEDWGEGPAPWHQATFADGSPAFTLRAGRHADRLYLLLEAFDASRERGEAHWPNAVRRDHLLLHADGPHGPQGLRLANAESGPLRLAGLDDAPPLLRIEGYWRELADGYRVELALPPAYAVRELGVVQVDRDHEGRERIAPDGVGEPRRWRLSEGSSALAGSLSGLLPAGTRASLYQADGWRLARAGALDGGDVASEVPAWRRLLYRWLLMARDPVWDGRDPASLRSEDDAVWQALSGRAATAWRRDAFGQRQWLSAAVPLVQAGGARAALRLEREETAALQLADRALIGLAWSSGLALLGGGGLVFLFATRLSWRIRRLRDSAEAALDREGRLRGFPPSSAGDEIGDLSRSFARLVEELGQQTDYLRSLAGTLSHELNTPLAIVRSSLDMLDQSQLPPGEATYLARARDGAERLDRLVRAMSEASRLQRAIESAEAEEVDLRALLAASAEAYRPLLAPRRLELELPSQPVRLHGAPDLISQALDKLVDNARSFSPEDGWLRLGLESDADGVLIRLANSGPLLPPGPPARLFDSLVSLRPRGASGGLHLGFGLTVVRMVAELHGGAASAANLPAEDGVEFRLRLRGMPQQGAGSRSALR